VVDQPAIRAGYADCRFGQIHYRARTPAAGNLEPLLFLNPRSRSCLRLLPSIEAQRPVYIVDVPAYGASSPPTESCTMEEVAAAVVQFMDDVRISAAHFCGFHTGAKVAAALAANWPARAVSLVVCGKSHSLIPDRQARNAAMRGQLALRKPDVALVAMESFCADDDGRARGVARVYDANFAFDLAGAMAKAACPTLVIEFTAPDEDVRHGRQAKALAAQAREGQALELAEIESMGVDLYVGAETLGRALRAFVGRLTA